MKIDVAKEYNPYPAGRFPEDGTYNGERFRDEFLAPEIKRIYDSGSNEELTIDIDGVRSFGSSFLEEAFAGLIRKGFFPKDVVQRIIRIHCSKPHLYFFRDAIISYIAEARKETRTKLAS